MIKKYENWPDAWELWLYLEYAVFMLVSWPGKKIKKLKKIQWMSFVALLVFRVSGQILSYDTDASQITNSIFLYYFVLRKKIKKSVISGMNFISKDHIRETFLMLSECNC